jgi:UDP-glucose 4-epimerase
MPTALITGVAGFIGSSLAASLLDRGYTVHGVDNLSTGYRHNLKDIRSDSAFSFAEIDIRDTAEIADAISGAKYVFHQAAVSSVPRSIDKPVTSTDVNCTGTATVLDEARKASVDTVVVASSSSIYGTGEGLPKVETMAEQPESPYALSKYYTEKLTLQFSQLYDISTVALRYFNVFGSNQDPNGEYAAVIPKFINRMINNKQPIIYGDGEQSRDFTHVDNVIRANVLAAEGDVSGEAFNIGTGSRITINQLVEKINSYMGKSIEPIHDDPRRGDVRHSYADISKAAELLNYKPTVTFEDGLERTIDSLPSA